MRPSCGCGGWGDSVARCGVYRRGGEDHTTHISLALTTAGETLPSRAQSVVLSFRPPPTHEKREKLEERERERRGWLLLPVSLARALPLSPSTRPPQRGGLSAPTTLFLRHAPRTAAGAATPSAGHLQQRVRRIRELCERRGLRRRRARLPIHGLRVWDRLRGASLPFEFRRAAPHSNLLAAPLAPFEPLRASPHSNLSAPRPIHPLSPCTRFLPAAHPEDTRPLPLSCRTVA